VLVAAALATGAIEGVLIAGLRSEAERVTDRRGRMTAASTLPEADADRVREGVAEAIVGGPDGLRKTLQFRYFKRELDAPAASG
jgi:hypothetical protein